MSLRAKRRRRSAAPRVRLAPTGLNQIWSMDFKHDRLKGDRPAKFRLLTVVDIFTRECLALEVAPGFRACHAVQVLSRLMMNRGGPTAIRCDQGTEFTAEALDQWGLQQPHRARLLKARKPTDDAFIEAFNASVREELLNTSWFDTLEAAPHAVRSWRREYNEIRPHRSLAKKTPKAFAASAKLAS